MTTMKDFRTFVAVMTLFAVILGLLLILAACSDAPRDTSPPGINTDCGYGRHYDDRTAECRPNQG